MLGGSTAQTKWWYRLVSSGGTATLGGGTTSTWEIRDEIFFISNFEVIWGL